MSGRGDGGTTSGASRCLTTEAVPTRIVEALDAESARRGEKQDDRFKVYEFGLPDSARDTVTIELQRACKKESLPELVRAYCEQYPDADIIADMVKNRISDFAVTTHMSAKGSNAFIGSHIIAFYNAPSPALFGELGALNTRFGRSDLVRLFYLDRFDQTCGRNRGFRGEHARDHKAVFPPRLHSWLAPALSSASYVGVQAKPSVTMNVDTNQLNDRLLSLADAASLAMQSVAPTMGCNKDQTCVPDLYFTQYFGFEREGSILLSANRI